jgi:hypothetical protein
MRRRSVYKSDAWSYNVVALTPHLKTTPTSLFANIVLTELLPCPLLRKHAGVFLKTTSLGLLNFGAALANVQSLINISTLIET